MHASWSAGAGSVLDCTLDSFEEVGEREDVSQTDINYGQPLSPPTWDCGGIKQLLQQQTASTMVQKGTLPQVIHSNGCQTAQHQLPLM